MELSIGIMAIAALTSAALPSSIKVMLNIKTAPHGRRRLPLARRTLLAPTLTALAAQMRKW
jgi:hypothetical protein